MSENRTTSLWESGPSSLKNFDFSKYKVGEWEDMEEDMLLYTLDKMEERDKKLEKEKLEKENPEEESPEKENHGNGNL